MLRQFVRPLAGLLAATIALAACSGSAGPTPAPATTAPTAAPSVAATPAPATPDVSPGTGGTPVPTAAATPVVTPNPAVAALEAKAWATAPLTDARTGETFRVADLAGKVVFLESMAIWCTNCRAQQHEATSALEGLDPERVVWLAIDVDPSEQAPDLVAYANDQGFPHRYAIATPDVARALAAEFGDLVLSPPSVPIVIIGADGSVEASFGHQSVARIREIAAARGA